MQNKQSMRNLSKKQYQVAPIRRNSCCCSECGSKSKKNDLLPNQCTEIAMHKKIRLANILINNLGPTNKFSRTANKYKNYKVFSRNRQQIMDAQLFTESSQFTKSPNSNSNDSDVMMLTSRYEQQPLQHRSNGHINSFLQDYKVQLTRTNRTLNQLMLTSRHITEPDEIQHFHKKTTTSSVIKTIKTKPYKSAYTVQLPYMKLHQYHKTQFFK